ncbi:MAG TPA: alpha/beta hydrolase [Candidatus Baltobacteraceae bacterium]|nr:alpha/beta hydrolase [Candidatus Baltobacteraceae bacterium]
MIHVEERVSLDDGTQTTLERWGNRGPVMLCVHGMTSSRKSWERLAQHYSDKARIYAYDQRGHGDSANVPGPMSLHRALLDLYNVLDAIPDTVDILVGHSWGGAVAILGGRRFDVSRIVAIDPMIRQAGNGWYDEFISELRVQFSKRGDARDALIRQEYAKLGWGEADIDGKVHAVRNMTVSPIERLRDENPAETWDLRRDLEDYPKPLLIAVADSEESIVTLEDLKYVRERGGPNVAIRVFEGQGHNLHRTGFEALVREMDSYFDRTGPLVSVS